MYSNNIFNLTNSLNIEFKINNDLILNFKFNIKIM